MMGLRNPEAGHRIRLMRLGERLHWEYDCCEHHCCLHRHRPQPPGSCQRQGCGNARVHSPLDGSLMVVHQSPPSHVLPHCGPCRLGRPRCRHTEAEDGSEDGSPIWGGGRVSSLRYGDRMGTGNHVCGMREGRAVLNEHEDTHGHAPWHAPVDGNGPAWYATAHAEYVQMHTNIHCI